MTDIPANAAPAAAVATPTGDRWDTGWRVVLRSALPFMVVGALWEIVAHLGLFHPRLFPTLENVAATFVRLTAEGILPHHAFETVLRLLAGFALAAVAGVVIGIAMGRSRRAEDFLLPLVSIGAPIPGIAYAPLFLLWFGLGNFPVILLVGFVSAFPIIFNTWTGVKAVKEIWVRAAQAMGADNRRLFARSAPLHLHRPPPRPRAGLAHPRRRRDAGRRAMGARLAHLRRARVPQHRRDAGRHRGDRRHRRPAREAGVPAARGLHRRALGDGNGMSANADRITSIRRGALALLAAAAAYEAMARSGHFPPALLPTLPTVFHTLVTMLLDGSMLVHAAGTMYRMLSGFALAIVVGLPIGILMGRYRAVEHFFLPLASALMPIPSFAWVPVFILWFGIGNTVAVLIVFYAATFPMMINAWSGVRAVNQLWIRAACAMGANEHALFWKVILPGASPFIITGLRQAFLRAWIAVVGAELIATSDWGLGWVIYDAKEFLNADVMLASLIVIGGIGFAFERVVFGGLERATVMRWGMVRSAKA
jgi:NitT/TauT family transport system permease protein